MQTNTNALSQVTQTFERKLIDFWLFAYYAHLYANACACIHTCI